jgi:hypothetical protein
VCYNRCHGNALNLFIYLSISALEVVKHVSLPVLLFSVKISVPIELAHEGHVFQTPGSNSSRDTHREMLRCECLHPDVRAAPPLHRAALRISLFYLRIESQGIPDTETCNKYKLVINYLTLSMLRTRYLVYRHCPILSGDALKGLNCDFFAMV